MALADELKTLGDRVLAELDAAHDYYVDTKVAWNIVGETVTQGRNFINRNAATGTTTDQTELVEKSREYVKRLAEATFQQFVSIFESFFLDLTRLWLMAYPQSLSGKKVDFQSVLDAPDKDAIKLLVINKELNDVTYDRPSGWFKYLDDKAKLGCPTADEIERIAEIKAARDVLVHNRGVANKTYEAKAGNLARFRDGQRIDISEPYHRECWELFRKVTADMADAALGKSS